MWNQLNLTSKRISNESQNQWAPYIKPVLIDMHPLWILFPETVTKTLDINTRKQEPRKRRVSMPWAAKILRKQKKRTYQIELAGISAIMQERPGFIEGQLQCTKCLNSWFAKSSPFGIQGRSNGLHSFHQCCQGCAHSRMELHSFISSRASDNCSFNYTLNTYESMQLKISVKVTIQVGS